MPESVVVVAGATVAQSVGAPTLYGLSNEIAQDNYYSKVLSPREYGNYLPDFWQFAKENARLASEVNHYPTHSALAERGWKIITQNIGSLHQRAGSQEVVEIYGSLFRARCMRCQHEQPITREGYDNLAPGEVPACEKCGKMRMRPDICLPGEGMRHRKVAEKYLADATDVVYLGVDAFSGPITEWYSRVPYSVLVNVEPWGNFTRVLEMSIDEWVAAGCPLNHLPH